MKRSQHSFFLFSAFFILLVTGLAVHAEWTKTVSPVRRAVAAALAPIQKALTEAGNFVEDAAQSVRNDRNLEAENAALRSRIADYEARMREADFLAAENDALRDLLKMQRRYTEYDMITASVIASQTGAYSVTYTLGCGTDDGVSAGNAVLVWEGMAGVITAAGPNWSEMITVLDEDFSAGAMISRSRETCVAQGAPLHCREGTLQCIYLPQNSTAHSGDRVVTSGLGGVFPPNLLIGRIGEPRQEENGLSCSAMIKPAAELGSLRQVFIITGFTVSE